jgi:hypothetical protein
MSETRNNLDAYGRLRLAALEPKKFEDFFLHFLKSGVTLTVSHHGRELKKRVISAETYAAGSGKKQRGIDLKVGVTGREGREEVWAFECKRHKSWTRQETVEAIAAAREYHAKHYVLAVACDPPAEVHDEVAKHGDVTLWNLDTICAEFRLRVPPHQQPKILSFIGFDSAEIKRFVGFSTRALVTLEEFFERYLGEEKLFRHDWKLVGRDNELKALDNFVADKDRQALLLVSKGGDGKSRLLLEFSRRVVTSVPGAQVMFLNPHSKDEPEFAFLTDAPLKLLVIDDAHRTETVPPSLLSHIRTDPKAKVILATRPQGMSALGQRLFEAGLSETWTTLSLPRLKKAETKELAVQALGSDLTIHAADLAALTSDCPFLTVLAGDLLRQGKLRWGCWASQHDFRQHIFRAFVEENIRQVPESERELTRRLMQLVAMLAPATGAPDFFEKAALCLGRTAFDVETQLRRYLAPTGVVVGDERGFRLVPDLLADFLVYDACFDPSTKLSDFVGRVLKEFGEASPALLRNLAEAAWVAQANGIEDDTYLSQLVVAEERRFEQSSFFKRGKFLEYWATFSVYLPKETLELARLALDRTTAPEETEMRECWGSTGRRMDSHSYVVERMPKLIESVAKFHDAYRRPALDLLWQLGLSAPWEAIGSSQNHPWSIIASVLKFEPHKPISVIRSTLDWLEAKVQQPDVLSALEGPPPILRTLLSPCFDRFVEFDEWEGRSLMWWQRPVDIERTRPLRDQALRIIERVIEHGSWRSALNALSALEEGIGRVAPVETSHVGDPKAFIAAWRPERLKALAVYEKALAAQSHVAVRDQIRRTLRMDLGFEEDSEFKAAVRQVVSLISEDLPLRVAGILVSVEGTFELDEAPPDTEEGQAKHREHWKQHIRHVAQELIRNHPAAAGLFPFLWSLGADLKQAGQSPNYSSLFQEIARAAPEMGVGLAREILQANAENPLVRQWPVLIADNVRLSDEGRMDFLRAAAGSTTPGVSAAAVSFLCWRARRDQALDESETLLLLEVAPRASQEEAWHLLEFVKRAGETLLPSALSILMRLPLAQHAEAMLRDIFDVLIPRKGRRASLPPEVVRHLLQQLARVKKMDLHSYRREWDVLCESHPVEVYEFLRNRIELSLSNDAPEGFQPVPHGYRTSFRLPRLKESPEYPSICQDLWNRIQNHREAASWRWLEIFQAVVMEDVDFWLPRLQQAVESADSIDRLGWLAHVIRFEGSLVIFRFPALTRAFLVSARTLNEPDSFHKIRGLLHVSCGPQFRSYSGGVLDSGLDYVEAEAAKAAETHATDPVLGPFYRWIVEVEQKDRLWHRMQSEASLAALD